METVDRLVEALTAEAVRNEIILFHKVRYLPWISAYNKLGLPYKGIFRPFHAFVHANCTKMQRVNYNLVLLTRTICEKIS